MLGRSPNRILEYMVVKQAVRTFITQTYRNEFVRQDEKKSCPILSNTNLTKARDFRKLISDLKYTEPCANAFWKRKYGIKIEDMHWKLSRNVTSETRLRELAWKILHNIYPTRILLKKIGIADNENCKFCQGERDFIEHFFFHCNKIKALYKIIEDKVYSKFKYKLTLTEEEVLLGITSKKKGTKEIRNYTNYLILIAKMCCGIIKYNKDIFPSILFERECRKRKIDLENVSELH